MMLPVKRRKFLLDDPDMKLKTLELAKNKIFHITRHYTFCDSKALTVEMLYTHKLSNSDPVFIFCVCKVIGFVEYVKYKRTLNENEFHSFLKMFPPKFTLTNLKYNLNDWEIQKFQSFPKHCLGTFIVDNNSTEIPELPRGFKIRKEIPNDPKYADLTVHINGLQGLV